MADPEEDTGKMPVPPGSEEDSAVPLVTMLYSQGRDLYHIPASAKGCWLSVKTYPLPATQLSADTIYLGPAVTADGQGWRKAYALAWRAILPGDLVTLPANDPMVADYQAYGTLTNF